MHIGEPRRVLAVEPVVDPVPDRDAPGRDVPGGDVPGRSADPLPVAPRPVAAAAPDRGADVRPPAR